MRSPTFSLANSESGLTAYSIVIASIQSSIFPASMVAVLEAGSSAFTVPCIGYRLACGVELQAVRKSASKENRAKRRVIAPYHRKAERVASRTGSESASSSLGGAGLPSRPALFSIYSSVRSSTERRTPSAQRPDSGIGSARRPGMARWQRMVSRHAPAQAEPPNQERKAKASDA